MEKTLAFILVILLYTCSFGQETFYTSGQGTGKWNDPQSWTLGENGPVANQVPNPESNIVIRHTLTHKIETAYQHLGKVLIQKGSTYELSGQGSYSYGGSLFELEGTLIAAANFIHESADSSISNLVVRNTGLLYAVGDLHVKQGSEILFEQYMCGGIYIFGTLKIQGGESRMLGNAKIISEAVRAWNTDGTEIDDENELIEHVALRLGNNIRIFKTEHDCEAGNTVVSGKGGHVVDIDINHFQAATKDIAVNIRWETISLASLPDFALERAWEGEDFSLLQRVSSSEINQTEGVYQIADKENLGETRKYRLSYTNEQGAQVILGVIEAGGGPNFEAYPNPYQGEILSLQMQGFKEDQTLSIKILDLQGRKLWETEAISNALGNVSYQAQPQLPPGSYMIFVESTDVRKSQRLVVL